MIYATRYIKLTATAVTYEAKQSRLTTLLHSMLTTVQEYIS